jgi:hypothetical protein
MDFPVLHIITGVAYGDDEAEEWPSYVQNTLELE